MYIDAADIKHIHKIFECDESISETADIRRKYFLAACVHFDSNIPTDLATKLRPYGGLIGIENSRLDNYLKYSKVLRLHAILHDAAGFVKDLNSKGPGYCYAIDYSANSCFMGHVSGIAFCLFLKIFPPDIFHLLEC